MHEKSPSHSYEDVLEALGLPAERGRKVINSALSGLQTEKGANAEEIRLRDEMLEGGEKLAREEEDAYRQASEGLGGVGLSVLASSTENLGQDVVDLERKRIGSLASFIDARFSSDPKESKTADDHWGAYRDASSSRAGLMAGVVDTARRGFFFSNNPYYESMSDRLSHISGIPGDQDQMAIALRSYIEEPIESREKELDQQVEQYSENLQKTLDGLVLDLEAVAGKSSLPETISKISKTLVDLGNKEYYDAIKQYVALKAKNLPASHPSPSPVQTGATTANKPSSDAQKGVDRVLELLGL